VYQRFRDGKEIDVTSLVEELRLPYGWVHEAIEFLRELGLVAHARVTQPDKTERDQILPTQPAETISLGQLAKLRETPISDWLETWEPNSSKALKDHINKIKAGRFDNSADALSTLLGHQTST
jgi:hypothetical protein